MERTRHFTATTYVVADGAVPLHRHHRHDKWLPPGGHVDRGELPHEAALREVHEETGLEPELVAEVEAIASETAEALPRPRHVMLADVNVHDGDVGHQHVDLVHYAAAETRAIDPAGDDEQPAEDWSWFGRSALADHDGVDADVTEIGRRAIETVEAWRDDR